MSSCAAKSLCSGPTQIVMIGEVRVLCDESLLADSQRLTQWGIKERSYLPVGGLPSSLVALSGFFGVTAFSRNDLLALFVDLAARCLEKLSL